MSHNDRWSLLLTGCASHPRRHRRCNVVVAGLWGICVFGELRDGASIAVFFGSCGAVLIVAVLLALYGPQETRR